MGMVRTGGKPFVAVCDDCGTASAVDANRQVDPPSGRTEEYPQLPDGWKYHGGSLYLRCKGCCAAVEEALLARRRRT